VAQAKEDPEGIIELLRSKLLHGDDVLAIQPKEPLIDEWLDQGDIAELLGAPGGGKSFVAIDMAGCIATGQDWQGYKTAAGSVLYVIAEGAHGVPQRWRAWKAHNKVEGEVSNLHWLPMRINLRDRQWSRGLAELALEFSPKLVVVDTLNMTMDGGDENSATDMGAYVAGIKDIQELTGACVLVLHHPGHTDRAAGGRGHSSLYGALDAELMLKKTHKRRFTLKSTKQKDKEEIDEAIGFKLTPAGPRDADGRQSVAVERDEDIDAGMAEEQANQLFAVLEDLRGLAASDGISASVWMKASHERGHVNSEAVFHRVKRQLEAKGAIYRQGNGNQTRWLPRRSAFTNPSMLLDEDPEELALLDDD
jgi:hypothetical protein